ncbi:unnamed protein product [Adineta ricciae]|uniref:Uncharacterized protein n=1 Tax=Adineta ricciae TaxID=249248 RepID=A0A813XDL2_ADIRI|nr:unnamed protein product [Adineta ricciae]CAF0865372.1 unnamed protein product [Adineta ricciae]
MWLFVLLLSISFPVKCQTLKNDTLGISLAITNAQTVIPCGLSVDVYPAFDREQIITCPSVTVDDSLTFVNITIQNKEDPHIRLSDQLISPPKLFAKLENNSFVYVSNTTATDVYYLIFSSELLCRYSSSNDMVTCFYHPKTVDFVQLEQQFDTSTNISFISTNHKRRDFTITFVIIGILILLLCICVMYILCKNPFPLDHMIQLDYIIDPQLARQAALKLSPEPV